MLAMVSHWLPVGLRKVVTGLEYTIKFFIIAFMHYGS